jgi:ABC-type branched-subunit amino acid transport system substrate-binding protein
MQKLFRSAVCAEGSLDLERAFMTLGTTEGGVYTKRHKMVVRSLTYAVTGLALLLPVRVYPQSSAKLQLRIGLITANDPASAAVARGVRLGAAEANQTAALFGDAVQLVEVSGSPGAAAQSANRLLAARKVQLLVGTSAQDADALSRLAESRHVVFFNAASRAQSLRSTCRRYTFHIQATDAMYANALALATREITQAVGTGRRLTHSESVVLWNPALQRFGASQLNDRYWDKYNLGMDGNAWAGWAAVKIAADAALRARTTAPQKLLAYLESPSTQFDGHKGWPLTFRLADHQLRQPLYMVVPSPRPGTPQKLRDVPELRAARDEGASDDSAVRASDQALDALVASPTTRACRWTSK